LKNCWTDEVGYHPASCRWSFKFTLTKKIVVYTDTTGFMPVVVQFTLTKKIVVFTDTTGFMPMVVQLRANQEPVTFTDTTRLHAGGRSNWGFDHRHTFLKARPQLQPLEAGDQPKTETPPT
jgi:hypothetical protein